jgi:hypothetical protein
MSILGIYIKQPVEVEIYGIQFATDMASTDQITEAWQMIARDTADAWDRVVQEVPYTVLLTDSGRQLVTISDMTLPAAAPDGFRVYIANKSQDTAIFVDAITVPARGAIILARVDGEWVEEAKTNAILVDAISDQRVRTRVFGGTPFESYRVEVTVSTSEGRTMQNEFVVEIEEE